MINWTDNFSEFRKKVESGFGKIEELAINAPDLYDLRHDGKLIMRGTEAECYGKLHRIQSQSVDWALKYEGYTINPMNEDWRDYYTWYAE